MVFLSIPFFDFYLKVTQTIFGSWFPITHDIGFFLDRVFGSSQKMDSEKRCYNVEKYDMT